MQSDEKKADSLRAETEHQRSVVRQEARTIARDIESRSPLPEGEARELAELIRQMGDDGILLTLQNIDEEPDYNYRARLKIDTRYASVANAGYDENRQIVDQANDIARSSRTWRPSSRTNEIDLISEEQRPPVAISGSCNNEEILSMLRNEAHEHFSYDISHPDFHAYCRVTFLCRETQSGRCTRGNAYRLLKKFPAPQIDSFSGAKTDGVSPLTVGNVSHTVIEEDLAVANFTVPGEHMLHPGGVYRKIIVLDGFLYVGTYGEGIVSARENYGATGAALDKISDLIVGRPFLAGINEGMAEQVWGGVDRLIIAGMASLPD